MKVAYLTYPYTDDPERRIREVKELARKIISRNPDLVLIVPHLAVDTPEVRDVILEFYGPVGFAKWDLALIKCCHAVIIGYPTGRPEGPWSPHPMDYTVSRGAVWEVAFAELEGKEIIDVRDLITEGEFKEIVGG